MNSSVVVTTVKDKLSLSDRAKRIAHSLGCPYVERQDRSFATLLAAYGHQVTIVVGEKHVSAWVGDEEFFFHPSMALLRLMNYLKGDPDRMAEAMGILPGMTVLDCTLGFGTDALVASFLTGPEGKVVGLEASNIVATLVKEGMAAFRPKIHAGLDVEKAQVLGGLPQACERITVVCQEHLEYLKNIPTKSMDIVYFDPMFRKPCTDSSSISPLRSLALPNPVSPEAIQQACRVARHRVVLKESRYSGEFARLGFQVVPGGKYSQIAFGVIEIGGYDT